jgi:hypothetical protein
VIRAFPVATRQQRPRLDRGRPGHVDSRFWRLHVVVLIVATAMLTPVQADERANIGNPLWGISLSALPATTQRPLFSPSRRPPPPVVPTIVVAPASALPRPAEPDHPLLTLLGTIAGERQAMAVFLDDATKNIIRLMLGQDYGGWTLRSVRGRQVEFEKEHRIARLVLLRSETQTISPNDSEIKPYLATQRQRGGYSHPQIGPAQTNDHAPLETSTEGELNPAKLLQ